MILIYSKWIRSPEKKQGSIVMFWLHCHAHQSSRGPCPVTSPYSCTSTTSWAPRVENENLAAGLPH